MKNLVSQKVMITTVLSCFISLLLFYYVPSIDLVISNVFYENGEWPLRFATVTKAVYGILKYLPHVLLPFLIVMFVMTFIRRTGPERLRKIYRSTWAFLLCTLLVGPGLIVHLGFKEGFNRPKPVDVVAFDGEYEFIPAFTVSKDCRHCKSFTSGHAAMGFWFMAFAWVFGLKRWLLIGIAMGLMAGALRIMQGGHFLSDVIFSGYITFFTCLLFVPIIRRNATIN